jgi:glycine hydroxymethyltransferase
MSFLRQTDPEMYEVIERERKRQQEIVNLIASENYTSRAVLEAQGSFLTYKYAEGYPVNAIMKAAPISTPWRHWR